MKHRISVFLASLAVFVLTQVCAAERPNILFILADDQRNDTLGCAGHDIIMTPVIDKLAAEGVRFENAFVTTSICAASRASIFTGLTERTHGYTFGKPPVSVAHAGASYPALLKAAGYRTAHFGKYGVRMQTKPDALFDDFLGRDRPYFKDDGQHADEIATNRMIQFIQRSDSKQPFCAQISFNSAHAEDRDKKPGKQGHFPVIEEAMPLYEGLEMPAPRLGNRKYFDVLPEFLKTSMNEDRFHWRWDTPEKYQANMRAYYALISGIDIMIGRILGVLEAKGLAKNTIVIYTGDNGYYMGDRGLAGKWSHFEQSLRVPLIVYDPRLPAGKRNRVVDPMALNIDITATILEFAGVDRPDHYQGRSLQPIIQGRTPDDWRRDFFCEHLMNHKMIPKWEGVRGERFVYARYFEQEPVYEFLHDLNEDPDQFVNLADDPKLADVIAEMRQRTDQYVHGYRIEQ